MLSIRQGLFRSIGALALSFAALMASGCGNQSAAPENSSASTHSIETKFGTVTLPDNPQRVVALGWGDAETALALGVEPVGASDWLGFGGDGVGPWAQGLYSSSPEIIETMEPSYEKIASLHPDLILDVKSSGDQERYDKLSAIAPTVGIPAGADSYLTSLEQQVTMISQALGKVDEGKKLLDSMDDLIAKTAQEHPQFSSKTMTIAAYTSNGWGAYTTGDSRVDLLSRLGFILNDKVKSVDSDSFFIPVSAENIDMLDADLLITLPIFIADSEVTSQDLYQNLPAVKDGRSLLLGENHKDIANAFSANTVLSIPYALDKMPALLDTAIKG